MIPLHHWCFGVGTAATTSNASFLPLATEVTCTGLYPLSGKMVSDTYQQPTDKAGDTTVRDSSDELAVELQSREEKTYQTTDESKRDIKVALNIWKQSLEAENKRLCEVLPAVQQRYEVLVKQRNALVENVNTLRDAVGLPRYITESIFFDPSIFGSRCRFRPSLGDSPPTRLRPLLIAFKYAARLF
ncbi:unnamed protein product [Nippostrongylus brasiliensis]|uniref:Nucleotide exchange factor GrpE n=1 Tax=Nippostrongylus brasiliensis TaxID=27835 RepID=A0A0N4YNE1_NIPBR|nr:unnamed protein product [Nippostrongylus brasiliensis]